MLLWNRVLLVICCWTLVAMWTEESPIIRVASLQNTVSAAPQSEEMLIQNLAQKVMSDYMKTVHKRPDWLHVLLTNVKHEWQMRTAKLGCNATNDFCLYRLDYLAKPSKLSSTVGGEALVGKRNRRDVELDATTKESIAAEPTEPRTTLPGTTTKVDASLESKPESTVQQEATSHSTAPPTSPESSPSTIADPVTSTITETPTTTTTTTEATTTSTNAPETSTGSVPPPTTQSPVEANKEVIMRSCNEEERKECKHAKSCDYVYLLRNILCKCKLGFMGVRCDMFDLGSTVEKLTPYRQNPIDITAMRDEDAQEFLSVIEASSRYTLNVYFETLPD